MYPFEDTEFNQAPHSLSGDVPMSSLFSAGPRGTQDMVMVLTALGVVLADV